MADLQASKSDPSPVDTAKWDALFFGHKIERILCTNCIFLFYFLLALAQYANNRILEFRSRIQ